MLPTKFIQPHFRHAYQRTDLYNLLDELSAMPLIRVCSCPGSGKTTLISDYVQSRNIPCLWYHLDRDDEILATFFNNLRFAVASINPGNKTDVPRISPERILNETSLSREYFKKLYQYIEIPFIIVFDNYQALSTDATLHKIIIEACVALPHGGRIVLISDGDRPPSLPKLPADLATATLCCEELQLSLWDIKKIAASHGISLLSDQVANQLYKKSDGWIGRVVHELQTEALPQ